MRLDLDMLENHGLYVDTSRGGRVIDIHLATDASGYDLGRVADAISEHFQFSGAARDSIYSSISDAVEFEVIRKLAF